MTLQKAATTTRKMAASLLELQQEEKLIDLWPDYPCLHDFGTTEFKNKILRDQVIEELAKNVNQTGNKTLSTIYKMSKDARVTNKSKTTINTKSRPAKKSPSEIKLFSLLN